MGNTILRQVTFKFIQLKTTAIKQDALYELLVALCAIKTVH